MPRRDCHQWTSQARVSERAKAWPRKRGLVSFGPKWWLAGAPAGCRASDVVANPRVEGALDLGSCIDAHVCSAPASASVALILGPVTVKEGASWTSSPRHLQLRVTGTAPNRPTVVQGERGEAPGGECVEGKLDLESGIGSYVSSKMFC